MAAWKLISLLLRYPDQDLLAAGNEIERAVRALPAGEQRRALERFCTDLRNWSAGDAERRYVEVFDLGRRTSLHLSYYLLGDTRRRGMELLRLKRIYAACGLVLEAGELPDHLPVMLEFAALAPAEAGERLLASYRPALEVLRAALHEKRSPYALVLDSICASLPGLRPGEAERVRRLITEGPPTEQVGLEPFGPTEVMPGLGKRR
jgi:nitrate reductase delta subunit